MAETVQWLSKKRRSVQTDGPKARPSGRDRNLDSDTLKFNLKKFNKLISADIAKTRGRMSSRLGPQSIASSVCSAPMEDSRLNVNSNIDSDLPDHEQQQA